LGALHTTLSRLERKGLICSWLGEPRPIRGGRAKRYYRIAAEGECVLQDKEAARSGFRTALLNPNAPL
jgi:DNA-binding PadR family transcriptional regulator